MIFIDIHVPALNMTYDFSVDENLPIRSVITYMKERILEREQCESEGDPKGLILCDLERKLILKDNNTLAEYGIENGAELMLL